MVTWSTLLLAREQQARENSCALFLYLSSPQLADNMAKFAAMAAAK